MRFAGTILANNPYVSSLTNEDKSRNTYGREGSEDSGPYSAERWGPAPIPQEERQVAGLPEALTEWITGTTRFPGAKTVDSWLDRKRSSGLELPDVTSGTNFNLRGGNSLLQQPY